MKAVLFYLIVLCAGLPAGLYSQGNHTPTETVDVPFLNGDTLKFRMLKGDSIGFRLPFYSHPQGRDIPPYGRPF